MEIKQETLYSAKIQIKHEHIERYKTKITFTDKYKVYTQYAINNTGKWKVNEKVNEKWTCVIQKHVFIMPRLKKYTINIKNKWISNKFMLRERLIYYFSKITTRNC